MPNPQQALQKRKRFFWGQVIGFTAIIGLPLMFYKPPEAPHNEPKKHVTVEQMCDELGKLRMYGYAKQEFEDCMQFRNNLMGYARGDHLR